MVFDTPTSPNLINSLNVFLTCCVISFLISLNSSPRKKKAIFSTILYNFFPILHHIFPGIYYLNHLSRLCDAFPFLVFIRNIKLSLIIDRYSFYANLRVIPRKTALIVRMIKVCALICKLCLITENYKSVCKSPVIYKTAFYSLLKVLRRTIFRMS